MLKSEKQINILINLPRNKFMSSSMNQASSAFFKETIFSNITVILFYFVIV